MDENMHKGILAYIIVLLILVVVVFLVLRPHAATKTATTITTKNTTVATTTIPNSTVVTTISNATTITIPSCLSLAQTVPIYNGNFSTGNYTGWEVSGYGFGTSPLNLTYANQNMGYYNHTWVDYNGTFVATTFHGGLALQNGNLTSMPFKVVEPYLNFKIISPQNNLLYVEILSNGKPVIVAHYNTYNAPNNPYPSSQLANASMPLSLLMCQNVSIKVVAGVVGSLATRNQYIAIGDFYQSRQPVSTPGIIVNQTIIG